MFNVASGGRGEEDGGGAKSNDGEKAWSAINNSILSEVNISGQITAKSSALYILFNISSLGRYVFGSEISYNKAPPRLPGLH